MASLASLLVLLLGGAATAMAEERAVVRSIPAKKLADEQIGWLRAKGGYYSPKISIEPIFESDADDVPLGVFAREGIAEGERIMEVPRKCVLTAGEYSDGICGTTKNLIKQHELKEQSEFAPYVSYLFNKGDDVSLPSSWSPASKELLLKIRGDQLPPKDLTTMTFEENCGGSGDRLEEFAYRSVVSRAWTDNLVPLFDMVNHQSGQHANVDSTSVHDGENDITVHATRDIEAGEQLFLSYMDCIDEKGFENEYVLPHILRDFCFVDQYPQRWTFPTGPDQDLVFDIEEDMNIIWRTDEPSEEQTDFLKKELSRLEELKVYVNTALVNLDSDLERSVALDYYESLITALRHATVYESTNWLACNDYNEFKENSDEVYGFGSKYQKIGVRYGEEDDDACLYLNGYLHACASSRPHYHEVFVHYAARYLDQVRRVIFIGGGDSMVLHEVLKYPSLELVVGLELDQEVNRATFSNFGTEPHYDNPKVQWYYGDAAKSMLVLPSDYYGSFDLVIVDILTEVADMLVVNDELSLVDAAMFLMKPGGIIVKNEDEGYVPGSKAGYTKYSLDLVYHDVPLYCLQVFVLGSNTVDFLTATPKDHGVETLYLKSIDDFESQFDSWYNFGVERDGMNSFCKKQAESNANKRKGNASAQSVGVLMSLEVEDIKAPLDSAVAVKATVTQALGVAGLSETGVTSSLLLNGGFTLVVNVSEGYIMARCIPLLHYCALDIQLYGTGVQKLDRVKAELIGALLSEQSSSYTFVTDGMFIGKDDGMDKMIGPPSAKDICDSIHDHGMTRAPTMIRNARGAEDFETPQPATLHSYDHSSALNQWHSQNPIGRQVFIQFEARFPLPIDSASALFMDSIDPILARLAEEDEDVGATESRNLVSFSYVGEGMTIVATWMGGTFVATFDGKSRMSLNLFMLDIDTRIAEIKDLYEDWAITSVEDFPRGTGSVVIFKDDSEIEEPIWA